MKKARLKKQQPEKEEEYKPYSVGKFFVFLTFILVILVGFYFLTDKVFKPKAEEKVEEKEEVTINERANNNINYSDIKDIKEKEYNVLFYKESDEKNNTYDMFINSLKANNMGNKFYYVNLDKEENKNIVDKKSSFKDINKLKVKDTTLIIVSDSKIKENYEGSSDIEKYLTSFFVTTSETEDNKKEDSKTETKDK